jgi:hypothetical protein
VHVRAPVRRAWAVTTATVLVLSGAACTQQLGAEPPAASRSSNANVPAARSVRVGLTEWEVHTSVPEVVPGRVRLTVTNAGGTAHDLVVRGEAGTWATESLAPGESARLQITSRPGERLELWCDKPGHRTQGMETTLRVAAG